MPGNCVLYYITARTAFPGDELGRRRRLLEKIGQAARCAVDYIQLREKDLSARELESLAREAVSIVRSNSKQNGYLRTRILVNSRTDVAITTGADGVHLRAADVSPADVRTMWRMGAGAFERENAPAEPQVGVSCRSVDDVARAAAAGGNFA